MFTMWGKIIKDNKLLKDFTVHIEDYSLTRTQKVYKSLSSICYEFDLATPIWLKKNQNEFIKHSKTRFSQDNFIETIEFDYLEFILLEDDY